MELFIARQPIFDLKRKVFGYELLFRSGPENYFSAHDGDQASTKVVTESTSVHGLDNLTGGRKAFVNVTRKVLLDEDYLILPPEQTVVELLETVEPDEAIMRACRAVRQRGYLLALDDFVFDPKYDALLSEIDILKVDFADSDAEQRQTFSRCSRDKGFQLLAEKVETYEQLQEASNLGYDLFQGYFFCKPQIISTRELRGVKLNYLRFLQELSRPELDLDEVDQIIRQDVTLAYKLLKYLNSAAVGLRHQVTSIKHAIALLGERALRKWASLIALNSLGEDKPPELFCTSLVRASFCEHIASELDWTEQSNDLFILGMFSVIDALVDQPMSEVLRGIDLNPEVEQTLLHQTTSISPIFQLVLALERADWDQVVACGEELGVVESAIHQCYRDAIDWAAAVVKSQDGARNTDTKAAG